VIYWLEKFRGGDAKDPAFQWKVIENFVNAVYLYDDRIRIVYNYTKQGAETVDLQFVEGLAEASGEVFGLGASCSTNHGTDGCCPSISLFDNQSTGDSDPKGQNGPADRSGPSTPSTVKRARTAGREARRKIPYTPHKKKGPKTP